MKASKQYFILNFRFDKFFPSFLLSPYFLLSFSHDNLYEFIHWHIKDANNTSKLDKNFSYNGGTQF